MHAVFLKGKAEKVNGLCKMQPYRVKQAGFIPLLDNKLWTQSTCKFIQVRYFYCIRNGSFQICVTAVEIERNMHFLLKNKLLITWCS